LTIQIYRQHWGKTHGEDKNKNNQQIYNTTQKTKKMRNTDPNKNPPFITTCILNNWSWLLELRVSYELETNKKNILGLIYIVTSEHLQNCLSIAGKSNAPYSTFHIVSQCSSSEILGIFFDVVHRWW